MKLKLQVCDPGSGPYTYIRTVKSNGQIIKESSVPRANGFRNALGVKQAIQLHKMEAEEAGHELVGWKRPLRTYLRYLDSYAK